MISSLSEGFFSFFFLFVFVNKQSMLIWLMKLSQKENVKILPNSPLIFYPINCTCTCPVYVFILDEWILFTDICSMFSDLQCSDMIFNAEDSWLHHGWWASCGRMYRVRWLSDWADTRLVWPCPIQMATSALMWPDILASNITSKHRGSLNIEQKPMKTIHSSKT